MLNIVKISGKPGSGKSLALNAIIGSIGAGKVVLVSGMNGNNASSIARAIRGYRDVVLCVDECPASLLEELKHHQELSCGRVIRIYAVVEEPQVNAELLEALERTLQQPLTGSPSHERLVEFWEYEKSQGRGDADDQLFALAAIAKAKAVKS